MRSLTKRGPNANAPAKLPGIQAERVLDPNTRQAIMALREWVEVRLGARGDRYEKAVTLRELQSVIDSVDVLERSVATLSPTSSSSSTDLSTVKNDVTATKTAISDIQAQLRRLRTDIATLSVKVIQLESASLAYLRADEFNIYTRHQYVSPITLEYDTDGKVNLDAELSDRFVVEMTQNISITEPTNLQDGMELRLVVRQDDIGGHTASFSSVWDFGDAVVPSIGTSAGAVTFIRAYYVEFSNRLLCQVVNGGSLYTRAIGASSGIAVGTGLSSLGVGSSSATATAAAVTGLRQADGSSSAVATTAAVTDLRQAVAAASASAAVSGAA